MNNPHRSYDALIRCRDAAGSDSQLGRDLGITQSTIDIYPVDLDVVAPMDCDSPQSSEPNGAAHRLSEGIE